MTADLITRQRKTPYNSTYPKGGVSCSADSFVVTESSVLRMKFSAKNPALRVAAKRCAQAKRVKMKSNFETKILIELISHSPKNSELVINGFYNGTLSEKSFRRLFDEKTVPNRADFAHYKILLTQKYIEVLKDILEKEGHDLIAEITHFAIKSEDGFSAISYDGMSSLYVNPSHFSADLKPLKEYEREDIVIEFRNILTDNGFFDWK